MPTTIATLTKAELNEMIENTVEKKLLELLGDPDGGFVLKKSLHSRLLRQKKAVARGQRGEDFNEVVTRLRLQ